MLNLYKLLERPAHILSSPEDFTLEAVASQALFLQQFSDVLVPDQPLATILDGYVEALLRIEHTKRDATSTSANKSSPEKEDFDPYVPVRSALAHLTASELSMVAHHLSLTLIKKRGWRMDANGVDLVTESMSDILSDFATNGITE